MPGTSDRFFKNCSVNIKIAHFTSKSLIFVLCPGSGCILFAHWINQCQFGYRTTSARKIYYFGNTKSNFGVMPGITNRFFKNSSILIKIAHLTSKSLIFVLCSRSGCLHFVYYLNQYQFGYKRSSAHKILYFSNNKCSFCVMPGIPEWIFKN